MFSAVITLLKVFFDICFLRRNPQSLPRSSELLVICLFAYTLIDILLVSQTGPLIDAILAAAIETFVLMLMTYLILKMHDLQVRWNQTVIALAGVGFLFGLLALPLFYGGLLVDSEKTSVPLLFIFLALVIWNIVVIGHILRHAIDTTLGFGIVLGVIYIWVTTTVIALLLPSQRI